MIRLLLALFVALLVAGLCRADCSGGNRKPARAIQRVVSAPGRAVVALKQNRPLLRIFRR